MSREPEPIGSILPDVLVRLRTLQEIREDRRPVDVAAERFRRAVKDSRPGGAA